MRRRVSSDPRDPPVAVDTEDALLTEDERVWTLISEPIASKGSIVSVLVSSQRRAV